MYFDQLLGAARTQNRLIVQPDPEKDKLGDSNDVIIPGLVKRAISTLDLGTLLALNP